MNNKKSFLLKTKFLTVGIIVGVFGTIATTSIAAQIPSLVGKKIQAEYTINVDGKNLDTKAIVVEGVSHLPVRKVSEIYGADITVKDKVITMNTKDTVEDIQQPSNNDDSTEEKKTDNSKDIKGYQASLENINSMLNGAQKGLEKDNRALQEALERKYDNDLIEKIKEKINETTEVIMKLERSKRDIEKRIGELEGGE
ncbi:hypothetical protein QJQ58_15640 [Paenibacillus dendritiformis]|uniref:hypothetical protein n=1 Tax=Paenibacillus dendritiformis TaxID=130049 RepID=UPI00248C53F0|nr:hypothetical protein [Paenibacillus dendritiformis]WGU92044.1 hypothetical protein QJQ58_15640 [Paenibacillus dendritiformis]